MFQWYPWWEIKHNVRYELNLVFLQKREDFSEYLLVVTWLVAQWYVNAGDATLIPWVEKEMATHSSILAWKSHRQRSLVSYSPCDPGVTRVGHDSETKHHHHHHHHITWLLNCLILVLRIPFITHYIFFLMSRYFIPFLLKPVVTLSFWPILLIHKPQTLAQQLKLLVACLKSE